MMSLRSTVEPPSLSAVAMRKRGTLRFETLDGEPWTKVLQGEGPQLIAVALLKACSDVLRAQSHAGCSLGMIV